MSPRDSTSCNCPNGSRPSYGREGGLSRPANANRDGRTRNAHFEWASAIPSRSRISKAAWHAFSLAFAIAIEERMMSGLTETERGQFRTWLVRAAVALTSAPLDQPPAG